MIDQKTNVKASVFTARSVGILRLTASFPQKGVISVFVINPSGSVIQEIEVSNAGSMENALLETKEFLEQKGIHNSMMI